MSNQLDIQALESAAAQVSVISSNFSTELASLGQLVSDTTSFWSDPAQASFEAKYNEFKGTMSQFIDALNNYSQAMKIYAQRQTDVTQSGAVMFSGI